MSEWAKDRMCTLQTNQENAIFFSLTEYRHIDRENELQAHTKKIEENRGKWSQWQCNYNKQTWMLKANKTAGYQGVQKQLQK